MKVTPCDANRTWQALHNFWFGKISHTQEYLNDRLKLWFFKDARYDERAREEFAPWLIAAVEGAFESWKATPQGYLSLILLLDQIPRNAFRDSAKAFAFDALALELAESALKQRLDQKLDPLERFFCYLPLEHAEDLDRQRRSVEKFRELHATSPDTLKSFTAILLDYAIRHEVVIEKFGRYPHRNRVLQRACTAEEAEYLALPGSGF